MGFNPSGGKIQNATDVGLGANHTYPPSSDGQFLGYSTTDGLWENMPLTGFAALATGGGVETLSTVSGASGTVTLNLANGNVFNVTQTGDVTFVFSGSSAGACSFGVYLHQDGTGGHAVTWPSGIVKWANGGVVPSASTGANQVDVYVFETFNNGVSWYGAQVGANFVFGP